MQDLNGADYQEFKNKKITALHLPVLLLGIILATLWLATRILAMHHHHSEFGSSLCEYSLSSRINLSESNVAFDMAGQCPRQQDDDRCRTPWISALHHPNAGGWRLFSLLWF